MVEEKKTVRVIRAGAADFVWRPSGAMARYAERGYRLTESEPAAQRRLLRYYTGVGEGRVVQVVRNPGKLHIRYAAASQRIDPQVTDQLS